MYNVSTVEIFDSSADLNDQPSDLGECEKLALLEHIGQRSVGAKFQHDICGCLEGECAVEGDDVGM